MAEGAFSSPSGLEALVAQWLTERGVSFEAQVPLNEFFVVDFRVGRVVIEVNGCYWHGCPIHYSDLNEKQRERKLRDKKVATYCRTHDLPLLVIWEHDIRNGDFSVLEAFFQTV